MFPGAASGRLGPRGRRGAQLSRAAAYTGVMEPIEEVLRYPTRRDDWVRTVLVGGALSLFSFLVLPAVLVAGYALRVIRARVEGEAEPPAFEDWGGLLVDGLRAVVVWLVYSIVPAFLGLVVFGGAVAAMASGTDAGLAVGLLGFGLGGVVLLAVSLALFYLAPASLAAVAVTGRLGAGFDPAAIRAVVGTREYAVPWLWGLAVAVVGGAVANVVLVVPLLGWVAGALLLFYVEVVLAALWGAAYADATALPRVEVPPPDAAPA